MLIGGGFCLYCSSRLGTQRGISLRTLFVVHGVSRYKACPKLIQPLLFNFWCFRFDVSVVYSSIQNTLNYLRTIASCHMILRRLDPRLNKPRRDAKLNLWCILSRSYIRYYSRNNQHKLQYRHVSISVYPCWISSTGCSSDNSTCVRYVFLPSASVFSLPGIGLCSQTSILDVWCRDLAARPTETLQTGHDHICLACSAWYLWSDSLYLSFSSWNHICLFSNDRISASGYFANSLRC